MGLCASCLGLNRHPSHKQAETDGLLNSRRSSHYGAIDVDEAGEAEQDEEEVRLEREALEVISARAADDMIDVLHTDLLPAETTDTHRLQQAEVAYEEEPETEDNDAEDVEQAWLQSLPVNELDQDVAVKGSYAGNLVIDLSALRDQGAGLSRRAL